MQLGRAARITLALAINYLTFARLWAGHGGQVSLQDRARWLQRSCRRVASAFQIDVRAEGALPASGLIASNHLSYLDVLAYAAVTPCVFVSKAEVLHWPVFGMLARFGGTLFVQRERRAAVDAVARQMEAVLAAGLPLVLFPEGTSTDGSEVRPYFPSLLEAAVRCQTILTPAAIGYAAPGWREVDFCYYGGVSLLPHLRSLLRVPRTQARISFGKGLSGFVDRKQAAQQLHKHTVALRAAMLEQAAPFTA